MVRRPEISELAFDRSQLGTEVGVIAADDGVLSIFSGCDVLLRYRSTSPSPSSAGSRDAIALQRVLDQLIPAAVGNLVAALRAGDHQPLLGARHRDIEQAAIFVARGLLRRAARIAHGADVVAARGRPDQRAIFQSEQARIARAGRRRGGVGQE